VRSRLGASLWVGSPKTQSRIRTQLTSIRLCLLRNEASVRARQSKLALTFAGTREQQIKAAQQTVLDGQADMLSGISLVRVRLVEIRRYRINRFAITPKARVYNSELRS